MLSYIIIFNSAGSNFHDGEPVSHNYMQIFHCLHLLVFQFSIFFSENTGSDGTILGRNMLLQ